MGNGPENDMYRFLVKPKRSGDPRSAGFLKDAHALGCLQVQEIYCYDLYFLRGLLKDGEAARICRELLADAVTQDVEVSVLPVEGWPWSANSIKNISHRLIEVTLRPGVTDPAAEQLLRAMRVSGISGIHTASTGLHFEISGEDLTDSLLDQLARRLLANEVIQRYTLGEILPSFTDNIQSNSLVETIRLRGLDPAGLMAVSARRRAALNLDEMQAIQAYCEIEQRDLSDIEFEMLAQTWSEHCVHKTFKSRVTVEQDESRGIKRFPDEYSHLFNQTIKAATREIGAGWVVSAFTDNAGVVKFDDEFELSFKVETHNHPSAIEPFGGANTGIGGVIRDVIGVSAKPVASTDVLCFGPLQASLEDLPEGVLHPRRIASGVIAGIQDYGNKMGIPTVNGAVWYDPDYTANPLVFCGSIGLAPQGSNPKAVEDGDHVIVLGGRTGRDGLRGATFSSMTMDAQTGEVSGASVQIGSPIVEKGLVDVLMLARDQRLYHAITDCGAGGLSSAVGEMGSSTGAEIQLERVPLKYPGLAPWEIWLSEAQERMVVAAPAGTIPTLQALCDLYEVEMTDIGVFSSTGRTRVLYGEKSVLDLDNHFLDAGLPQRHYRAIIRRGHLPAGREAHDEDLRTLDGRTALLRLLAHPNIASKEAIIRVYDHEVMGATAVKPLCGVQHDGPSDGCVMKPLAARGPEAFVLSNGLNPEYGKIDPYEMAFLVLDEAVRNALACGADPDRTAVLDNFCWGDPTDPKTMGDLVQAAQGCYDAAVHYHTPFISGKDSFNNEYLGSDGKRHAIPPTLLISALGWMPDWQNAMTMDLKQAGDLIYLVGDFQPGFGGSHFNLTNPERAVNEGIPHCSPLNPKVYRAFYQASSQRLAAACHDLSEGGLGVAAAEMCMAGRLGARLNLPETFSPARLLFGETSGCLLVEVSPAKQEYFLAAMSGMPCLQIGETTGHPALLAFQNGSELLNVRLGSLLRAWKEGWAG